MNQRIGLTAKVPAKVYENDITLQAGVQIQKGYLYSFLLNGLIGASWTNTNHII